MEIKYLPRDVEGFRTYLAQRYDLNGSLAEWIELKLKSEEVKRSEQVTEVFSLIKKNT